MEWLFLDIFSEVYKRKYFQNIYGEAGYFQNTHTKNIGLGIFQA